MPCTSLNTTHFFYYFVNCVNVFADITQIGVGGLWGCVGGGGGAREVVLAHGL